MSGTAPTLLLLGLLAALVLAHAGQKARAFRAAAADSSPPGEPASGEAAAAAPRGSRVAPHAPPAFPPLVLAISRAEVDALDVGPAVLRLQRWQQAGDIAAGSRCRVRIVVRGYGEDTRQLHGIDEIRDYFAGLLLAFRPWFFVADPASDSLRLLALSTSRVGLGRSGQPTVAPEDLQLFMRSQLRALRQYAADARLPLGMTEQIGRDALRSLTPLVNRG